MGPSTFGIEASFFVSIKGRTLVYDCGSSNRFFGCRFQCQNMMFPVLTSITIVSGMLESSDIPVPCKASVAVFELEM